MCNGIRWADPGELVRTIDSACLEGGKMFKRAGGAVGVTRLVFVRLEQASVAWNTAPSVDTPQGIRTWKQWGRHKLSGWETLL